ncbi:MAG TPA: ATP synthase F1 subunit gamma [Planctomycetota bacterium]|nr:ATP synthase F1 subunit gamma [Planctomycetota bacterium]
MAKGTKELKRRITGVKNIQQITKAMEMVATQKLRRLQSRAEAARPFASKIQELVGRLAGAVRKDLSPLLQEREIRRTANLVVSSDKGLCGGYNANLVRLVLATVPRDAGAAQRTRVLGVKGGAQLAAKRLPLDGIYEDSVEKIDFARVRSLVRELVNEFTAGSVDEVRLIYTSFLSSASQKPVVVTLLPIRPEELLAQAGAGQAGAGREFIIEPSPEELLRLILPKYLEIKAYTAVLESLASEFTARRNAMKQATDAADDIIGALRRQYNRARQESITKELLEVVSGAEALK